MNKLIYYFIVKMILVCLPMNNVNPTEYNNNIDVDQNPMDLYKLQNQQRQNDESEYKNLLNNHQNFENTVKRLKIVTN